MSDVDPAAEQLIGLLRSFDSCIVALSGGVDSAVVAQAAWKALGDQALAVTGVSASLAAGELDDARQIAHQIGLPHRLVETAEFARPEYVRNAGDRCYHCKTELYTHLRQLLEQGTWKVIVNGANADDLHDYRPGMRAAGEFQVRSPLAECGLTKADVRRLAAVWGLAVWDKPASPCLSSRVAYGEPVTPQRLAMIERAERWLHAAGFREVRVRYHGGDLARIEVPIELVSRLTAAPLREQVVSALLAAGFRFVTLDLQGFRSGSLNQLVSIQSSNPPR